MSIESKSMPAVLARASFSSPAMILFSVSCLENSAAQESSWFANSVSQSTPEP
jgi:hypothetical protein